MVNAFEPDGDLSHLQPLQKKMIERRERLLGPAYRLFYDTPAHFVKGEGVWLYDAQGDAYLDVYNNVVSVGHCHPHVVAALARQASILNTHTRYLDETVLDYAEKLLSNFPAPLSNVMFTCTGSEANDLALRIAQAYTGGTGVIVTQLAYHGCTQATAGLSPSLGPFIESGDHVRTVPAPDSYRNGPEVGAEFARHVRAAIKDMQTHGIKPAALLVDTIFSSDGVFSGPPGLLAQAVEAIREAGGVFVADEVQAGFARTGDAFWGFLRHGVVPDIVTMGKPMGNGHPIGATVTQPRMLAEFGKRTRYFNTFGGNPVSAAAGMAVLEVIERENLLENARIVGAYLRESIQSLAERHSIIGDVRGAGLFVGVELVRDRLTLDPATAETARLVNLMKQRRVLISAAGPHANVLKIRPPLVFTPQNVDQVVSALSGALDDL